MVDAMKFVPIAKGFSEIGVSLHSVFPDYLVAEKLYMNHSWSVQRTDALTVIHAIPADISIRGVFWEQWFSSPLSEASHHVLFRDEPDVPYHAMLEVSKENSGIVPPVMEGTLWYVVKLNTLMGWPFAEV